MKKSNSILFYPYRPYKTLKTRNKKYTKWGYRDWQGIFYGLFNSEETAYEDMKLRFFLGPPY